MFSKLLFKIYFIIKISSWDVLYYKVNGDKIMIFIFWVCFFMYINEIFNFLLDCFIRMRLIDLRVFVYFNLFNVGM